MKSWIKNNWHIILAIVVAGLCFIPFICNNWFFGTEEKCVFGKKLITPISEILKYVGAFIGGFLVAINAYFIYKRSKELNRSNYLVAKGQLGCKFFEC